MKKFFKRRKAQIIRNIIQITNAFLLLLNIFFLKNITKKFIYFKSSDIYILKNIFNESYIQISSYLNKKFEQKSFLSENKSSTDNSLKKIRLKILDSFNDVWQKDWLIKNLGDKFIFEFNSDEPDYLLFNIFGQNHKNISYENAIKIAFFTENIIPDLDEVDYAIGHSHINYLDRYFQYPLLLRTNYKIIEKNRNEVLNNPFRKKFCSAVISNYYSTDSFRLKFVEELNKYKKIDMGGQYNNNIGSTVKDKIVFLNSYKFSIAMENSNGDGYSTEKLIHSFISGTIPIYYGDYMIDEYFNPKTYILIKGEKDLNNKIEYIKLIDKDNEKYKFILKQKVILDEHLWDKVDQDLKKFFYNIFNQEKHKAFRIDK